MASLVIKQASTRAAIQNFCISVLKRPLHEFIVAMVLVPVALSLLFTPLFWLDMNGFNAKGGFGAGLPSRLFYTALYSLSLSTFGGPLIVQDSAYTFILRNLIKPMAQLMLVFLFGAVFFRLSQPAQPIRCSFCAIISEDELVGSQAGSVCVPDGGPHRSFSARFVLTAPMPNELIDVRISLTYRTFFKTEDDSLFVSMQPLALVRSDIPLLRHGLTVRHVVDRTSPVYGHTRTTMYEQDAVFILTIMGIEKTSMQQVFHRHEYCYNDGHVVWNADWVDMVFVSPDGQRVVDHTKLDAIQAKGAGVVRRAVTRTAKGAESHSAQYNANKQKAIVRGKSVQQQWLVL